MKNSIAARSRSGLQDDNYAGTEGPATAQASSMPFSQRLRGVFSSRVVRIFVLSALVVTVARLLAPFEVGTDQAVQLEAARRLVNGDGLTTTNEAVHHSRDISEPPTIGYLVQWPPGFSLIMAGFFLAGVPLLVSLKIVYTLVTLIGWLAWAVVINQLAPGPIKVFNKDFNVHYLFAVLLPILSTPLWKGTDIFLWAGIPILVLMLTKAPDSKHTSELIVGAGLLFGALCSIRYASAFLAPAAALSIIYASYPRVKTILKRLLLFFSPSLVFVVSLVIYLKLASHSPSGLPAQLTASGGFFGALSQKIQLILYGLPIVSNLVFGSPLVEYLTRAANSPALKYAVGISCLVLILCLPILVRMSRLTTTRDLAMSLSFLPLSLTVSLLVVRLLSDSSLFSIKRYYEPLFLCFVLICYAISMRVTNPLARVGSLSIVAVFVSYVILSTAAYLVIPQRRNQLIQSVLAFTPARSETQHSTSEDLSFPDWKTYSWKENSRRKVKELHAAYPQALFVAQEYPLYIYDDLGGALPTPGRALLDYPGAEYLYKAHTSRPIKVFWVLSAQTQPDFVDDDHVRLVHSDSIEKTRIYESDLPAGYTFRKP
jgi:hypothetical protein